MWDILSSGMGHLDILQNLSEWKPMLMVHAFFLFCFVTEFKSVLCVSMSVELPIGEGGLTSDYATEETQFLSTSIHQ